MKRTTYLLPSSSDIVKELNRKGVPYQIAYTNNTSNIKCEVEGKPVKYICSERGLPIKSLAFIQKVKSHVENLGRPQINVLAKDIQYFQFGRLESGHYEPVAEVDVNKAYWLLAYQKGYLSKQIYEQGLKIDKMTRLIAWGAIAASKRIYNVNQGKAELIDTKVNPVTRSYFFDVAHELGQIMSETLATHQKSILFYWVDAFFVKGRSVPAIIEKEMKLKGLPCKQVPLWWINIKERNKFSDLITVKEKGGKEKPFHRKKGNRQMFQLLEYCSTVEKAGNID